MIQWTDKGRGIQGWMETEGEGRVERGEEGGVGRDNMAWHSERKEKEKEGK